MLPCTLMLDSVLYCQGQHYWTIVSVTMGINVGQCFMLPRAALLDIVKCLYHGHKCWTLFCFAKAALTAGQYLV